MADAPSRGQRTAARTPASQIRTSLVTAGRAILEEKGPSGLTVRAVAAAAGVAPMGVYNHFDGKNGLLNAVVSDGFREFTVAVSPTDADPAARLAASGRAYRRFALANPTLYALMFAMEHLPDGDAAGRAFEALAEVVRYGQAGGIIRVGDPGEIAVQVWSCVHGAMSLELAGLPDFIDAEANYENVIALIARGLAPQ